MVKLRLEDFRRVDAVPFNAGEDNLYGAVIDPPGKYAYFAVATYPGSVVRLVFGCEVGYLPVVIRD